MITRIEVVRGSLKKGVGPTFFVYIKNAGVVEAPPGKIEIVTTLPFKKVEWVRHFDKLSPKREIRLRLRTPSDMENATRFRFTAQPRNIPKGGFEELDEDNNNCTVPYPRSTESRWSVACD